MPTWVWIILGIVLLPSVFTVALLWWYSKRGSP
jgi:hypothetical protein